MHVQILKQIKERAVVRHVFNLSAKEAGAGGSLSLRPGQPGIPQRNLISKRPKPNKPQTSKY